MTAVDGSAFLRESGVDLNMESGLAIRVLEGVVTAPSTVSDDFNRANGAPGSGWYSVAIADWTIVSNQLRKAISADSMMVWQTPNTSTTQEVSIKFTSNGNASSFVTMLVRISSASGQYGGGQTYYGAFFNMTGATCGFLSELGQFGTPVLPTLVNGVTYTALLRVEGERLSLFIDGVRCGTAEPIGGTPHVGNYVGFSCAAVGSPVLFDDFNSTTFTAQTATTDDFNRANTAPAANGGGLGDAWTTVGWQILGNAANSPGGNYAQHLTPLTNDHYMEADIIGWSSGYVFLTVRRPGNNIDTGYLAVIKAGGTDYEIAKLVNGSYTVLAAGTAAVQGTGTYRGRFEVVGNTLRFYRDGTLLITVTDTSLPTGRYTGMGSFVSGATIDNFACGALGATRISYSHALPTLQEELPYGGADTTAYSLGQDFSVLANTVIYGVRVWNPGERSLVRNLRIYNDASATIWKTLTAPNTLKPGWNEFLLAVPVMFVTGTTYTVSMNVQGGAAGQADEHFNDYGSKSLYLASNIDNGNIRMNLNGGRFTSGFNLNSQAGAAGSGSFNSSYYGFDLLYVPTSITAPEAVKVQEATNRSAATTSLAVTFGAAATAKNHIFLAVCSAATVNTPTGFTLIESNIATSGLYLFVKQAVGGETTVNVIPTLNATTLAYMWEVSGLFDVAATAIKDGSANLTDNVTTNGGYTAPVTGAVAAQADTYQVGIYGAGIAASVLAVDPGCLSTQFYGYTQLFDGAQAATPGNALNVSYRHNHTAGSKGFTAAHGVSLVTGAGLLTANFKVTPIAPVTLNPVGWPDGKVAGFTKFAGGFDLGKSQADVPNRFVVYDTGYINFFFARTLWNTPLSRAKHYISASLHGACWLIYNAAADGSSYNAIEVTATGDLQLLQEGGGGVFVNVGTPTNPYTLSIDATVAGNPVVKYNGVSVGAISLGGNVRNGSYVGIMLNTGSDAGTIQIGL